MLIIELVAALTMILIVFAGLLFEHKETKAELSQAEKEMKKAKLYSLYMMHKEQGNEIQANGYRMEMEFIR